MHGCTNNRGEKKTDSDILYKMTSLLYTVIVYSMVNEYNFNIISIVTKICFLIRVLKIGIDCKKKTSRAVYYENNFRVIISTTDVIIIII